MALSVKQPEADRLARELAAATGESLTEAVVSALRERLLRQHGKSRSQRSAGGALEAAIDADAIRLISAASVLETAIVAGARYGDIGCRELDLLLYKARIQIVAVTPDQVDAGRHASGKYGKGRHPAALNFGDCFSYALAQTSGEPLLFKGNDFSRTDLAIARL